MSFEIWPYTTPGIPDNFFFTGGVPLTKEEVRCLALCKARLKKDSVVYDIGSGTGSLALESALLAGEGTVYAVEKDGRALVALAENIRRFGAGNVVVVAGEAPEVLSGLPPADRVFIGGSGGRFEDILRAVSSKLKDKGRLVATAVTVETTAAAVKMLPLLGFAGVEVVMVTVARVKRAGRAGVWAGANPVCIIAGEKSGGCMDGENNQ